MNIKTASLVAAVGCAIAWAGRLIDLITFYKYYDRVSISNVCSIIFPVSLAVFFFILWSKQK